MLTLNLETADSRYMRNMWTETHQFIGVRSYIELGLDVVHSLGYHAARKTHLPLDSGVYLARPGYVFESLGCDWGSLITTAPWSAYGRKTMLGDGVAWRAFMVQTRRCWEVLVISCPLERLR